MPNLSDLTRKLRFRLQEITPGTWSDEELREVLNDSQRLVAENLHSNEYPWAQTLPWKTAAVSGSQYYVMEEDFLSVENVTHFRSGFDPYQLHPANVRALRSNIGTRYIGDTWYRWYELRGRAAPYVARGVATEGADGNVLEDTSHTSELGSVRVGDIVFNENDDDASATVRSVTATTLTVSNWVGGRNQGFTHGDAYRVAQRERNRQVMWVYPFIEFDGSTIYSGAPAMIRPERDDVARSISITFGSLDSEWDVNSDVRISIERGATEVASTSVRSPVADRETTVDVEPFAMDHNETYSVHAEGPTGSMTNHIREIKIYGTDEQNYLEIEYVPYPREMLNERSICELQDFQLEPMILQAKKLAWEKKKPDDPFIQQLIFEYEQALEDCEDTMFGRKPPGPEYVDGYDDHYDWWASQGYASVTGKIGDLL